MPKPSIEPKHKGSGPMNTLLKMNDEFDKSKQRSHKFIYKIQKEPFEPAKNNVHIGSLADA